MKREERARLGAIVDEVQSWVRQGRTTGHLAQHMPLSGQLSLSTEDVALLGDVARADGSHDLETVAPLLRARLFGGGKKLQPAHEAAGRVEAFQHYMAATRRDVALGELSQRLTDQHARERAELSETIEALSALRHDAAEALELAEHLPLTRGGALDREEQTSMESLVRIYDLHAQASNLLEGKACEQGRCQELHTSATLLRAVPTEARSSGNTRQISAAVKRITKRDQAESRELRRLMEKARAWSDRVTSIRIKRQEARAAITSRGTQLLDSKHYLKLGEVRLRLAPLTADDSTLVRHLALLRDSPLSAEDDRALTVATQNAKDQLASIMSARAWDCARTPMCKPAHQAATALQSAAGSVEELLGGLERGTRSAPSLDRLLDPTLGFAEQVKRSQQHFGLIDHRLTARARAGIGSIVDADKAAKAAVKAAKDAAKIVRALDVAATLGSMDLDVLRRASPESLRTRALANAGLTTVWAVRTYENRQRRLVDLPGLGEGSARAISQAALRLEHGVRDETPVRIDVKKRGKETEDLLKALRAWDASRRFEPTPEELALAQRLSEVLAMKPPATHVLVMSQKPGPDAAALPAMLTTLLDRAQTGASDSDIWIDFLSRPADYFGMLTELGFLTEDEKKMHGDLPEDVIEAVRAIELKRDHLKASLRAYQDFGARFVLAQKKVVIGDEMGLGKTVEALAVLTHLRSTGQTHFLVVCPAAVVSNWIREIARHTDLPASRIHGPSWERAYAIKRWLYNGGVAVTTFDLVNDLLPDVYDTEIACAIFDEAHYIKNPLAKRSVAAATLLERTPYAVLMTGTPLENRVQEFRNLIGYLRPDLSENAPDYLPSKFRKHVAPAYLRRNQEDVLTELPELVEVEEWMPMSSADARDYRSAVEESHFMKMRRAAMLSGDSTKLSRLMEIVDEAEENGRRVIVFSYFREVLDEVARRLPGPVFGPLTGSVAARDRQALVDKFSEASHGAALVAQITAGGVGLNIQSASVVVICEPQIKPTMEAQAIARAHRMGQTNSVQVHRLLNEDSVDERLVDILAEKRHLFDEFARDSVIAQTAPDALDITDAELARVVIAAERERLLGQASSEPSSDAT